MSSLTSHFHQVADAQILCPMFRVEQSTGVIGYPDAELTTESTGQCGHVTVHALQRYDAGMTKSKIAISLPRDQLARVQHEVRAGRADSVSGYIARVLAEQEKRESLRALLRDLVEQHGAPEAEDFKWAERALAPRRG